QLFCSRICASFTFRFRARYNQWSSEESEQTVFSCPLGLSQMVACRITGHAADFTDGRVPWNELLYPGLCALSDSCHNPRFVFVHTISHARRDQCRSRQTPRTDYGSPRERDHLSQRMDQARDHPASAYPPRKNSRHLRSSARRNETRAT